jgi:proteasome lid subunit RPN8/RPN11
MSKIRIRTTYDPVSPLIRSRPENSRDLRTFRSADNNFAAYVHADVLEFIRQQAILGGQNEAIGLIAGRICHDPRTGPYTLVLAAAEAREGEFRSTPSFVRLLPEGHRRLRHRLADAHPDREIVGWYHTHPNYEPYFSSVDFEEQKNWNDENQIGIVYGTEHTGEPFGVYQGPGAIPLTPVGKIDPLHDRPPRRSANRLEIRQAQNTPAPIIEPSASAGVQKAPRRIWYRRIEIVLPTVIVLILVAGGLTLLSINRRLSVAEKRLEELPHARPASERITETEPPHISAGLEAKPSVSPEVAEKLKRVDDPELNPPVKSLSPETTSSKKLTRQGVADSKSRASKRKRENNKKTEVGPRKQATPKKSLSAPGEQIFPSSSPKPNSPL